MSNNENFETAKLLHALSKALVKGDISLAFIDAAKAMVADGVEQESFALYIRCSIDDEYPMDSYLAEAATELNKVKPSNVSTYPH